jgi:hypothetical protein
MYNYYSQIKAFILQWDEMSDTAKVSEYTDFDEAQEDYEVIRHYFPDTYLVRVSASSSTPSKTPCVCAKKQPCEKKGNMPLSCACCPSLRFRKFPDPR